MKENNFFRFHGYKLADIDFKIVRDLEHFEASKQRLGIGIERGYSRKKGSNNFNVLLTCEITSPDDGVEDDHSLPFKLTVTIVGSFEYFGSDDSEVDHFLRKDAAVILFPYLRSSVSNVISMAGFPQIVLPLMNFYADEDEEL